MFKISRVLPLIAVGMFAASLCAAAPSKHLKAFESEKQLSDLFQGWADEIKRRQEEQRRKADAERKQRHAEGALNQPQAMAPATAAPGPALAKSAAAADSVTNVQTAGVDEGGIVKQHGKHLVILRRGRLFTVDIHDKQLTPIAAVNAFGGSVSAGGTWYDEMLIWGDTVAVVGYSYARGGTEIGLFKLSADGAIRYLATHHLRSNDYYSSRNYASRLIGSKLIFYTPLVMNPMRPPHEQLPAQRKWRPGVAAADFRPIAPASRIYHTHQPIDPSHGVALHSVTTCDLAQPELACESTAVLGPPGRVFYVSAQAVYVWTSVYRWPHDGNAAGPASTLFRIPLAGTPPSALKVAGGPVDQFSFLEGDDAFLNVLVRAEGRGEGMWAAESRRGELALLRVPLASFGDGDGAAGPERYRALPQPAPGALQNRYVGEHLIYGSGAGWRRPQTSDKPQVVHALRYTDMGDVYTLPLTHAVDRIEALGAHAVVVGSDGKNLGFTSLRLTRYPVVAGHYQRAGAAQGETRSHGFFYKPDSDYGGVVGLPIIGGDESAARQLRKPAASMLYLRNRSLELAEIGALDARPGASAVNDHCLASCVDWYGNSRPLFVQGRVFALMGYEIVEGRFDADRIVEARRVSFLPQPMEHLRP